MKRQTEAPLGVALGVPAGGPRRRWTAVLLGSLVLFTLALRIWIASGGLGSARFWDERYSFENVHAVVAGETLVPARGYYPILNHLPQSLVLSALDRLHRATGIDRLAVFRYPEAREEIATLGRVMRFYTPLAHAIGRGFPVLYGAASIVVIYLVGAQLAGPLAGWISAVLLTVSTWHVRTGVEFKPDALVILLMLGAFAATVAALKRPPDVRRYALAGALIALAPSAKLTGGLIAIPLVLGSLLLGVGDRRRIGYLCVAGVVSAGTFLLLNPHFRLYLWYLNVLDDFYARRAAEEGFTHLGTFWSGLRLPFEAYSFGLLGGLLCLLGTAALIWVIVRESGRRPWPPTATVLAFLVLVFPLLFLAVYAWSTAYYKPNNLMPYLTFVALHGGVGGAAILAVAARGLPVRPVVRVVWAVAILGALAAASTPFGYAYAQQVPSTLQQAVTFTAHEVRRLAGPIGARMVLLDSTADDTAAWSPRGAAPVLFPVADIGSLPAERVALFDGVIVRRDGLRGARGVLRWLGQAPRRAHQVFEPRPFRLRGPAIVAAVTRQWKLGEAMAAELRPDGSSLGVSLPAGGGDSHAHLVLDCPRGFHRVFDAVMPDPASDPLPIVWLTLSGGRELLATARFPLVDEGSRLAIELREAVAESLDCRAVATGWRVR